MKVEIFTLCDAATIDAAGKLNVLGSFDRLNSPAEPITHMHCALAIKLRFEMELLKCASKAMIPVAPYR